MLIAQSAPIPPAHRLVREPKNRSFSPQHCRFPTRDLVLHKVNACSSRLLSNPGNVTTIFVCIGTQAKVVAIRLWRITAYLREDKWNNVDPARLDARLGSRGGGNIKQNVLGVEPKWTERLGAGPLTGGWKCLAAIGCLFPVRGA